MIYILLPALNEEKNIKNVVDNIADVLAAKEEKFSFLVVDDGSTDKTKQIVLSELKQLPVDLISFESNRGVGAVFRTGFQKICAQAEEDDILIAMDCDSTHPAVALPSMIEKIRQGNDLVIASRYQKGSRALGLPLIRKVLSDAVNMMLRLYFRCKNAKDYTTFYRAYRISVLKKTLDAYGQDFITQPGFSCMAEILIKLSNSGAVIAETPIVLRFDLRTGKSKMRIFATIWGYLKLIACR